MASPNAQLGRRYLAAVSGTHRSRKSRSLSPRFIKYRLVTVFVAPLRRTTYLNEEMDNITHTVTLVNH